MKKIRVLHIIRTMEIGGAETLLMNIYRNIDRNRIQFDFLVCGKGFFDDEIRKLGGRIYYIPYLTKVGPILYKKYLKKFFNEHQEYQIVHSHIDQVSGLIVETAKECNIPIRISHSHNTGNSNNIIIKLYKIYLQSKINKNSTHFLACSIDAAKWLFKSKWNEAIIVNNGISVEKFKYSLEKRNKIRKELKIPEDFIIIGNIANLKKQKNHLFLVSIFNEYLKINSKSILLIVGTGKLKAKIEKKIKKLGIENNVKFLGKRNDTDYLYSAFDCFISPALYEGLGITLIEAQASGLETITSDKVVPKETKITNLIKYIDLKCDAKKWASEIEINKNERTLFNNEVLNSDFEIKKVSKDMQKFYEEII